MRKYYYYSFKTERNFGSGVWITDESCFDVFEAQDTVSKNCGEGCTILFWHEISCDQYEKMKEYFDNQNK